MVELTTNVLVSAGAEQMLLGEREAAFFRTCDSVCFVAHASDGWPALRLLDPRLSGLEMLNSRTLRLRLVDGLAIEPGPAPQKVALLMIRRSDGQHLVVHGHVMACQPAAESEDGGRWLRLAVAARSWSSPDAASVLDDGFQRAFERS